MVFSSPIFLFGFLPLALLIYYSTPSATKNAALLLISLLFYTWGEVFYLGVMLGSIFSNYIFGRLIHYAHNTHPPKSKFFLTTGIIINIALLISFKYANFITDNLNILLSQAHIPAINLAPIHLPLGISFFTFQAISYIVDVYRKEAKAQKNILDLALYISLFPQLIAGPIIRFHDITQQITSRSHTINLFASGVIKFTYGLAKKMLIANPLGEAADNIFALGSTELTMPLAWIGILSYSLQIYFDFSGYSDMAIGLGRMFGFRFQENFNYPYIATSLREFWRRWHISLSTWFRDYVYFSLGGNRVSPLKVYRNMLIVFLLTGFWHGASWSFLVWGLFHGLFLAGERAGLTKILKRAWKPLQHLYLLVVVSISWVFFRADTLPLAITYLKTLFNIEKFQLTYFQLLQVSTTESIYAFIIGSILSTPIYTWIKQLPQQGKPLHLVLTNTARILVPTTLLLFSIFKVASSTYNPFIYFRF